MVPSSFPPRSAPDIPCGAWWSLGLKINLTLPRSLLMLEFYQSGQPSQSLGVLLSATSMPNAWWSMTTITPRTWPTEAIGTMSKILKHIGV